MSARPFALHYVVVTCAAFASLATAAAPALGGDYQTVAIGQTAPPSRAIIFADSPGVADSGICDDIAPGMAGGDDVVRVAPGRSEPRMRAVRASSAGPGTVDSTPAGDD